MVTKGIIKSIDYNGNTCKVRVPILESACDDAEIVLSAIFATAPGIFNGYKEEDVVIVSFEDNNYENAIILGKLYLGASKENEDPRGTVSCANLKSENQATIPLSSKLVYDAKDKNTANVKGSYNDYKTLADIVDGLQTQKTEIGSINAQLIDTGDSIGARVSKLEEDSSRHEAELIVHADEIDAKVSKEHNDGTQKGLGWNLNEESWRINAYDEVSGKPDLKELNIVTIDRNGMTLNGDLKINGYPSEIVIKYARWAYPDNPPALYKDAGAKGSTDDYVGLYVFKSGKYVLVAEYNKDKLGIIANETIAYEIDADSWLDNEPDRADGEYIWQWTRTFKYEWIDTGALATSYWVSSYEDKIVCITGATGSTGEPATIYWAKLSTAVHTGKNQKSDIEITPYAKTGNSQEVVDTAAYFNYSLDNGANWKWKNDDWMSVASLQDNKIIILANDIRADNIIVKLAHAYTDPNDSSKLIYNEYETETITYSPLNTPIIDLTNDTDVIKYKPDGNKASADSYVSSTAQVYLGGSPEVASYDWAVTSGTATISKSNSKQTVTVNSITSDKAIITCTAETTNFKDESGKAVQISKDFVVSREVVVASYWLSFSPVHTGTLQQTDIEIKALAKIGNDSESKDTNAYFRYSWDNGTNWMPKDWTKPTDATLIIKKADIKNNNLRIQATHDSEGDNRQVYEDETITYSPLNTPVLDLTNDSDAIAYDDNTILGNSVSSTAVVYLNGSVISGCTFAWTAANCTISGATDSATVTVSAIDDNKSEGTATCRVTLIPNYRDTELVKVFTVAKQYKGNKGTDGPTPASSTTYYIYSADTPSLDDPKWKTDPANLDKPNGGYFCWTKTVTTYSNGKTITDGPNKDAAFALAQGKTTNYYGPTEPTHNIKEGDCWFKTISSTNSEYNEDAAGQKQGKLYQCSGFGADGKAIWEDVGGELVANKLTANYINALDITARKITVLQDNNDEQSQILFKADGTSKDGTVKIGGFDVKNNTLTATDNISANLVQLMPDKILMQATKSAYWFKNTRTIEDAHSTYSYAYLFKYLETAANPGSWEDISKNDYDYRISSKESPENKLVIVPYVEIYAKNAPDSTIFTFYYSYLNSITPYKYNGNDYEIWIEAGSKKRLLVPYGTTVINDGTYEYPIGTFITETNSTAWTKLDLDNNPTDYSKYSNYIYDNYTTYYDNYESSSSFNNGEYSYLKLKITKDIPTTFNIYLGISSNFNIAQNFDTVIALEPTDKDTPNFKFTEDSSYSFIESTDFILKASTSGNYVSGNLEDLVKVTYPSIVASEENPKYIYIIYVNRNNTKNITAIGSGTSTTVVDTAGFCVIPKFITYSDSKLSIGSNFKVTPSGQLTAKNAIFEDNVTLIGGGKLGAFELNNNKLSNSAMILDSTGISLKDYKYLSIGNNKQFRLFKSQIDKSYVDIGGSSTNTKNMVDVSYIQSYNPIIIQKLTPSNNSTSSQSTTSTLPGASILLTANENVVTQYFHITPTVRSITPVVSNISITLARPGNFGNDQIHTVHGTGNSVITGARYVIDFKVEVFEKDDKGNKKSEAAKKDYNFTFDAVFSTAISLLGSVIKSCSIRVPKGRSTASTSYSWTIQGVSSYEFKGIKNTGGSTTKEKLILTETFVDTATDTSAIQLKSASIYLNSNTYVNGDILTASDRNLKENIKYLDYYADYSNVFNYLKPVEFNYKNNNLTQFGFIAQDILEALPLLDETKKYSLVVKDNDHYAVDYNSIIALNTLQIKYLTNKISQLETAYNELLKKVEDK